jgi:guanosine-3',5'-bis(diphosphate) 3'-pyrophosphohydrolase
LQSPPKDWSFEKISEYRKQAILILDSLKGGNQYLEKRLLEKINDYLKYCVKITL